MNFNNKFMQEAIDRINELQQEVKDRSKMIDGAKEYVERQVQLYKETQELQNQAKYLQEEGTKIANNFFSSHFNMIDNKTYCSE